MRKISRTVGHLSLLMRAASLAVKSLLHSVCHHIFLLQYAKESSKCREIRKEFTVSGKRQNGLEFKEESFK